MGNPNQKWTVEEEDALRAGVARFGAGEWKLIQEDSQFNQILRFRSHIDLKDKWTDMNAAVHGSFGNLQTLESVPSQDTPANPSITSTSQSSASHVPVLHDSPTEFRNNSAKDISKANYSPSSTPRDSHLKVIQWEDFEQELARLVSLSSALQQAQQKKLALQHQLEALIQVQSESLTRKNELDEISERVGERKLVMENMLMQAKVVEEHAKTKEEHLGTEIKSLLVSGTSLSVARKKLQESGRSLAGERGFARLNGFQKMLRMRQQYMVSQIAYLYPVKTLIGAIQELELDSFASGSRAGTPSEMKAENKPRNQRTLTISGLQLNMLPFTQMTFFTDKKQIQRSTTALGYIAHAISLIASYLHVPLRYPLRLGGSHSYIKDFAPSTDAVSSGPSSTSLTNTNKKCLEFPLFLDGQDATRAAYAIFLLNKDIEQLLNYVGLDSLGPRHVLANLKELFKIILSPDFMEIE